MKKNRSNKDNFEKNHIKKQKKKKRKKTYIGKHYNNPQCFARKATVVILNQLNIKKIKSTKIILEKNIKTMWENIIAIHNVLKKKTTKLNS
jgi:glutaredoxin-related protein